MPNHISKARTYERVASLMTSPYATLALTMAWFIGLYVGAIGGFVFLFGAVLFFVIQFVYILSVASHPCLGKKIHLRAVFGIVVAYLIPILLLVNSRAIDRQLSYVLVWTLERHIHSQAEIAAVSRSAPDGAFKYFRLPFGKAMENQRWIVYDESDQVSLDYLERSADWWKSTHEDFEFEQSCLTNGTRLYSNFYVQYSNCY